MDTLNTKISREDRPVTLLTTDGLPFVSIVFVNSHVTQNYLVNKGVLELNVYTASRYDAMNIYRAAKALLQQRYEEFQVVHEGQVSSGVTGIYKYSVRFPPLIRS